MKSRFWRWRSREFRIGRHSLTFVAARRRRKPDGPVLTHLSASGNPLGTDAACGFTPGDGERFGMTSEHGLVTCPDCLLRAMS